jgi:lipoate synthase
MIEEKVLIQNFVAKKKKPRLPKPDWLKIKIGDPTNQNKVLKLIDGLNLHTVCQEARCPNILNAGRTKRRRLCSAATPARAIAVFAPSTKASRWI